MKSVLAPLGLSAVLVACGGVSPDPAQMAEQLPAGGPVDPETAALDQRRIDEAMVRLESGDFKAARELAETVLESDPRAARARAIRATALADEAKLEDPPELVLWRRAEGELRRASELAPDDRVVAILHTRFLRDDGHWTAAAERIERQLEVSSDDLDALRLAATLRYDLGDELAAIAHLELVLAVAPGDTEAWWRLAHARLRIALSESEEEARAVYVAGAIEAFVRYRELVPDDAAGWLGEARARIAGWPGEPEAAEVAAVLVLYQGAHEVAPESPDPDFGRGVVLDRTGDVAGAERAYRDALARDAGHLPSLLNLAANLDGQGRPDEARPFALRALEQDLTPSERRSIQDFLAGERPAASQP